MNDYKIMNNKKINNSVMKNLIIKRFFSFCILGLLFAGAVSAQEIDVRITNRAYVTSPSPAFVFDVEIKAGAGYVPNNATNGLWSATNLRFDIHGVPGVTFTPPSAATDVKSTSQIANIQSVSFGDLQLVTTPTQQSPLTAVAAFDITAIRGTAAADLGNSYVRLATIRIPITTVGTPTVFPDLTLREGPPNGNYGAARVSFWTNAQINRLLFNMATDVALNLTVFLQGVTKGSSMTNYIQSDVNGESFFSGSRLPNKDPYGMNESFTSINNVAIAGAVVDWIKVEIWSNVNMSAGTYILEEEKALLLRPDGKIVAINGSVPTFKAQTGPIRIVIKHRNHLGIMSNEIATFTGIVPPYDFSASLSQAAKMGSNDPDQMVQIGSKWCLWAGEVIDNDEYITNSDVSIIYNQYTAGTHYDSYLVTDLNMDGYVENADYSIVYAAFNRVIYSILAYFAD